MVRQLTDEQVRETAGLLGLGDAAAEGDVWREIHRIFRATFSTPDGRKALNVLLTELCYFNTERTERQAHLADFAEYLRLVLLGAEDTIAITNALLDVAQKNTGGE